MRLQASRGEREREPLPMWAAAAAAACALAGVYLDGGGDESQVRALFGSLKGALVAGTEPQRRSAGGALGLVRGGRALRLLMGELAFALEDSACQKEWARNAQANPASRYHGLMLALTSVFALLSRNRQWSMELRSCGTSLAPFAAYVSAAL
eukprot:3575111-Pleurochrysis_carterae.AAC.1